MTRAKVTGGALDDFAELAFDTGYERDARGLLLRVRDPDVPAPAFELARTPGGNRWLLSAALPPETRAALDALFAGEPIVASVDALEASEPRCRAAVLALLHGAGPPTREARGPAFVFPNLLVPPALPVEVLNDPRAVPAHPHLAWVAAVGEQGRPVVVARVGGVAVAVCYSSRRTPRAAAAGVDTTPEYRKRGLGRAVVAGWSGAVRASGRTPLYSTDWSNLASRAVARALGLVAYGETWTVR